MRGTKAKALRKKAGGNTAEYDTNKSTKIVGVDKGATGLGAIESVTYIYTLTKECTRSIYKAMKKESK